MAPVADVVSDRNGGSIISDMFMGDGLCRCFWYWVKLGPFVYRMGGGVLQMYCWLAKLLLVKNTSLSEDDDGCVVAFVAVVVLVDVVDVVFG